MDLIDHLKEKGITVIAVISNYDLVHHSLQANSEEKQIQIPGCYYEEVIRPFERLIQTDPDVNLQENTAYMSALTRQEKQYAEELHNSQKTAADLNVKHALANLLFKHIRNDCEKTGKPMPRFQFLDDRQHYLEAVVFAAKNQKINLKALLVTEHQSHKDYLHFFTPYLAYQNMIAQNFTEMKSLLDDMTRRLSGFIYDSQHKAVLLLPLQTILKVYEAIQKDMVKNPEKHDCIGACNALVAEMEKQNRVLSTTVWPLLKGKENEKTQCLRASSLIDAMSRQVPKVAEAVRETLTHVTPVAYVAREIETPQAESADATGQVTAPPPGRKPR